MHFFLTFASVLYTSNDFLTHAHKVERRNEVTASVDRSTESKVDESTELKHDGSLVWWYEGKTALPVFKKHWHLIPVVLLSPVIRVTFQGRYGELPALLVPLIAGFCSIAAIYLVYKRVVVQYVLFLTAIWLLTSVIYLVYCSNQLSTLISYVSAAILILFIIENSFALKRLAKSRNINAEGLFVTALLILPLLFFTIVLALALYGLPPTLETMTHLNGDD